MTFDLNFSYLLMKSYSFLEAFLLYKDLNQEGLVTLVL